MKYIRNDSINPYFNIAFEEYCLENIELNEDYFIIWQNGPSIIVGSHQNVFQEINPYFINHYNIPVVRRISGGGTVYHDLGNINFTFIFKNNKEYINYVTHNEKIMEVLAKLGLKTTMSKRHDILYKSKKISGNAQRIHKNRVLHHGTLLFDADLEYLTQSLRSSMKSIQSKAIESVRSHVTNIKEELNQDMTASEFKEFIIKSISNDYQDEEIKLTDFDHNEIEKRVNDKFLSWQWNYGESPTFKFHNKTSASGNEWSVDIRVKDGLIEYCDLRKNNKPFSHHLIGTRYDIVYLCEKNNFLDRASLLNLFFGEKT